MDNNFRHNTSKSLKLQVFTKIINFFSNGDQILVFNGIKFKLWNQCTLF